MPNHHINYGVCITFSIVNVDDNDDDGNDVDDDDDKPSSNHVYCMELMVDVCVLFFSLRHCNAFFLSSSLLNFV